MRLKLRRDLRDLDCYTKNTLVFWINGSGVLKCWNFRCHVLLPIIHSNYLMVTFYPGSGRTLIQQAVAKLVISLVLL